MPTFNIQAPVGVNQIVLQQEIQDALVEATRAGKLRPNSVDPITGHNSGDNLGPGTPVFHWNQWDNDSELEVKLLLKGGGCENQNAQYSLPMDLEELGRADRSLDGVRKCILHAIWHAQGLGCSPGAVGVCIGGDRASGYVHAKDQLFRLLGDTNPDPRLAKLEDYILRASNTLGIGTMGFGGEISLIGCKIAALNRLPASFFVSVAYECWAFRRLGVILDARTGALKRWLYRDEMNRKKEDPAWDFPRTGKEIVLETPITEDRIRDLRVGDLVLIRGDLFTGRDAVHLHLTKNDAPVNLNGSILYHCGPVVLQHNGEWQMKAAGPTTSMREEPYQADILGRFGIRAVMGKGGMGPRTLAGLQRHGAVYLNAVGGAAQYYTRCIRRIKSVHFQEFGLPEAMWQLEVQDFPAIVTMDASGHSLHADVASASRAMLSRLREAELE